MASCQFDEFVRSLRVSRKPADILPSKMNDALSVVNTDEAKASACAKIRQDILRASTDRSELIRTCVGVQAKLVAKLEESEKSGTAVVATRDKGAFEKGEAKSRVQQHGITSRQAKMELQLMQREERTERCFHLTSFSLTGLLMHDPTHTALSFKVISTADSHLVFAI